MPRSLLLLVLLLLHSDGARAEIADFQVIVHPNNPIEFIRREDLQAGYLKKIADWSDGEAIHPIDLSTKFPIRERFTREVIRKSPAQLRVYWNQRIFSGKGVPPLEVDSVRAVVDRVVGDRGAIGYLPAGADHGKAKVISVR